MLGFILVIGRFRTINQDLQKKVLERTAELHKLAILDELTQLANRRRFDECFVQEWLRARRRQQPLSLMMCDIDYFKNYNDTYGHPAGDECLYAVAQALKKSVKRPGEIVARYGGEEFAIILPNINSFEAAQLANLIRQAIHALKIPHKTSSVHTQITLSIGIATIIPKAYSSAQQLIQSADKALYQAKDQGRDCFASWQNSSDGDHQS